MPVQPSLPSAKKKTNEKYFFMVAAIVFYIKDDAPKQRHMNLLTELDQPAITHPVLSQIQEGLISRISQENEIEATDVKDIVILNIAFLGQMTSEQFHAKN